MDGEGQQHAHPQVEAGPVGQQAALVERDCAGHLHIGTRRAGRRKLAAEQVHDASLRQGNRVDAAPPSWGVVGRIVSVTQVGDVASVQIV